MMQIETDPKILAQLNASDNKNQPATVASVSSMVPETDPKILAQLEGISAQNNPTNISERMLQGINNFGAGVYRGIRDVTQPLANMGQSLAPNIFPKPPLDALLNQSISQGMINPKSYPFIGGELSSSLAPVPGLSSPVMKGIESAFEAPASIIQNYGEAPNISNIGSLALKPIAQVGNAAVNYMKTLLGNTPLSGINSQLAENIRNVFPTVKGVSTAKYDNVENLADQAGFNKNTFSPEVDFSKLGIGMGNQGASFTGIKATNSLSDLENLAANKNVPEDLKSLLSNFSQNPTFSNANILQQQMGDIGASYTKFGNDAVDRTAGLKIMGARSNLLQDINQTFNDAGRPDIAQAFTDASQYWKQNILPYKQNSFLDNVLQGKKTPSNLAANLMSDNAQINPVLGHLNQIGAGYSNRLMIADALSKGNAFKYDADGNLLVKNPATLQDNLNNINQLQAGGSQNMLANMSRILDPFVSTDEINHTQTLSNLLDSYKQASNISQTRNRLISLGKKAAGAGIAGAFFKNYATSGNNEE